MGKVVLIRPVNEGLVTDTPMGILHLGTVLEKEGYQVRLIDAAWQPDYRALIAKEVTGALLFGISCLTPEVPGAIEISDYIKSVSRVPIIWGGWHPTLFPEQTCSDKSVDFVCVGEGEYTLLGLVKALKTGSSFEDVSGLVYKKNGEIKVNPQKEFVNLEELPPINYDLVDISKYIGGKSGARRIIYQSSRWCPHRCKFCINMITGNQKYRSKSPKKVVDEIQFLIEKYNVNVIDFAEDNFFVDIKRSRGIIQEMIRRGLNTRWGCEFRIDYFRPNFVDEEMLALAQKSGLVNIRLGAESGSQRVLDMLAKDITIEQILTSARMLSKFELNTGYNFIIASPGETKLEMLQTVAFAKELYYKECPRCLCSFGTFTPYPRCEMTDYLIAQGYLEQPKTLREWGNQYSRELYYKRFSGKPWHEDPEFIGNLVHYARLAYNVYSLRTIKKLLGIKGLKEPVKCVRLFFVLLAQARMKRLFFRFPIDRILYEFLVSVYLKSAGITRRFRRK